MINKFEAIGILFCVGTMAVALFFMRVQGVSKQGVLSETQNQQASVVKARDTKALEQSIKESINMHGTIEKMIVDDVVVGVGDEVKKGDTVSVHYVGTLKDGEEFDNSQKRGEPFSFTVGEGRVIKGWDEGVIGMKVGGERVLVIPADMAYGNKTVGPIPANSTLVFSISLLKIN